VDFKDIDFSPKGKVKKLSLTKNETYAGNAAKAFQNSAPFKFLGLNQ
jgi:choloylglycine hydrolase